MEAERDELVAALPQPQSLHLRMLVRRYQERRSIFFGFCYGRLLASRDIFMTYEYTWPSCTN